MFVKILFRFHLDALEIVEWRFRQDCEAAQRKINTFHVTPFNPSPRGTIAVRRNDKKIAGRGETTDSGDFSAFNRTLGGQDTVRCAGRRCRWLLKNCEDTGEERSGKESSKFLPELVNEIQRDSMRALRALSC